MQKVHRCFAHITHELWWIFLTCQSQEAHILKNFSSMGIMSQASIVCKFWISGFYFTPCQRVLFTFPSRYLFTIDQRRIFRLWGWSPNLQARKFALLFFQKKKKSYRVITFFDKSFQSFLIFFLSFFQFENWKMPFPGSLATTTRISVDFYSFGYWDVSVRQVSWVQKVSHLEIYGSQNVSVFPIAFRAVLRPISSLPRHPSKTFSWKKVHSSSYTYFMKKNQMKIFDHGDEFMIKMI